jgi:hypothetical protein
VVDLPVWLSGDDHMCCGEARRAGQLVQISLAFSRAGRVQATTQPEHIAVLADGTVSIVGPADGATGGDGPFGWGTLVQSGAVQFAIPGDAPGPAVRCEGKLYEARHGEPSGTTTGQLIAIRWRPRQALTNGPGIELQGTDDRPGRVAEGPDNWAFELTIRVND